MFSFMLITLPGCYKEIHGKGEEVIKQLLWALSGKEVEIDSVRTKHKLLASSLCW
jgi:hypothetical protein